MLSLIYYHPLLGQCIQIEIHLSPYGKRYSLFFKRAFLLILSLIVYTWIQLGLVA